MFSDNDDEVLHNLCNLFNDNYITQDERDNSNDYNGNEWIHEEIGKLETGLHITTTLIVIIIVIF